MSGTWQTQSGAEYRIADDGKEITISLIDSSQIADFSAKLTRRDAKADAKFLDGKVEVVFAIDPKRTPRKIDVLGILDEKAPNVLRLRFAKWPFFDVNGNPRGTRLLNEELKKDQ